jgi:hypothetical protein
MKKIKVFAPLVIVTLVVLSFSSTTALSAEPCDASTACFDVSLSPATLTGDVYVDGNLIVGAVNTTRLTLTPATSYLIEFRNIQDPATPGFGDLFVYPNQSKAGQSTTAGRTRTVTFRPTKQYIKGVLEITCDPRGRKATDNVVCRPTIDGVVQADITPGAKATYNLPAGEHAVHTDLVGDQANNWSPTTRDDTVTVNAGRSSVQTTKLRTSFTLKGLIKISISTKGLVADLYLDGTLLASQAPSLDIYVTSGTHTVEAKAVTDPAANGQYVYADYASKVTVSAAGTRPVSLRPQKTWLVGFLVVSCQINRKLTTDDVRCLVNADGTDLGTTEAGQRSTFSLPIGSHAIVVSTTGASAGNWVSPVSTTANISGGRNSSYSARFNLKPLPTSTPAPTPFQDLVSLISPVDHGADATITVRTLPAVQCSITVYYKSGPSTAQGLSPQMANGDGICSWTWKVGTNTTPGTWRIVVTTGGVTKTYPFVVQ